MMDFALLGGALLLGALFVGLVSVRSRSFRVPSVEEFVGFLDSLSPLGYLLMATALPLHMLAVSVKAAVILTGRAGRPHRRVFAFASAVAVIAIASLIVEVGTPQFSLDNYAQYAGVSVSILLTAMVVAYRKDVRSYARGFVLTPTLVAFIHVVLTQTGQINDHFGRFYYVGNTHPNLGGEIAAAAALMAALALGKRSFLIAIVPLSVSALLLESRASIVAIFLMALLRLVADERHTSAIRKVALVCTAGILVLGAMAYTAGPAEVIAGDVLLVEDPYRGLDSGFSGRSEAWEDSIRAFATEPIAGSGIGLTEANDLTSHNAFLYGLSRHGLLSILYWLPIAAGMVALWERKRDVALLVAGLALLLLVNARFINMNPYPFVLYVVLLTAAEATDLTVMGRCSNATSSLP